MLICQLGAEFTEPSCGESSCDWSLAASAYPDLLEMPSFLAQQRQHYVVLSAQTSADPALLQGKQLVAYNIVKYHFADGSSLQPLRMIVTGAAGSGKSYLIQCLKKLLGDVLNVTAPTGAAAFIVDGVTLHSLFSLPVKGDFADLEGKRLQTIQQSMKGVNIDEMSMVGRKTFGKIDKRLRQVFPHR